MSSIHARFLTVFIEFIILGHFLSFLPPNDPENQFFKKMKKAPQGIIFVYHK